VEGDESPAVGKLRQKAAVPGIEKHGNQMKS
jgi:hypothetical protein